MLFFSLIACGEQAPKGKDIKAPKVVVVAPVEEHTLSHSYTLTTSTRSVERATVAPQVSGVLQKRFVDLGSRVTQGELLARFDNPELAPALNGATARLAELRLEYAQAERDWQRIGELFAKRVVTQREKEQAKTRCDSLMAAMKSAEAEVARAQRLVDELQLRAPIAGEVERIAVEPGEFVSPGQGVISIAGNSLEAEFGVPETLLREVSVGQAVKLTLPLFGQRPVQGHIVEMADIASMPTRLFPVVVALEHEEGLRPGLTVSWTLQSHGRSRLSVPLQALASPAGDTPRVYRLVGDRVEAIPVVPLEINGERVSVEGRLSAGDEIVVAGVSSLVHGHRVEVTR